MRVNPSRAAREPREKVLRLSEGGLAEEIEEGAATAETVLSKPDTSRPRYTSRCIPHASQPKPA